MALPPYRLGRTWLGRDSQESRPLVATSPLPHPKLPVDEVGGDTACPSSPSPQVSGAAQYRGQGGDLSWNLS